jgi:hypothetical protein
MFVCVCVCVQRVIASPPLITEPVSLCSAGTTLLDGEMVQHRTTGRTMYMIFDVLCVNNMPYAHRPLSERLPLIGAMVRKYRDIEAQLPPSHFILIGKSIQRIGARSITLLRSHIHLVS